MRASPRLPLRCAAALAALSGACSGGGSEGACGPILREALDPSSFVHVLGDEEPEYRSNPPTSGPHFKGPAFDGVYEYPIPRPIQVGELELGYVLIQHAADLDPGALEDLRALAGDGIVVAPNDDLESPVIATAWLHKMECDAVDIAALEEFIDERQGKGPDQD